MIVTVRVQAKTEEAYRIISFNAVSQELSCDCSGVGGGMCSHIDAVLIEGERHMVHPDDRENADLLMRDLPVLAIPDDWKGSWRKNKRWRGLEVAERSPSASRPTPQANSDDEYSKRPIIAFSGQFQRSRSELKDEAERLGWKAAGSISQRLSYLILSDESSSSRKAKAARDLGITILTITEWDEIKRHVIAQAALPPR